MSNIGRFERSFSSLHGSTVQPCSTQHEKLYILANLYTLYILYILYMGLLWSDVVCLHQSALPFAPRPSRRVQSVSDSGFKDLQRSGPSELASLGYLGLPRASLGPLES